MKATKLLSAIMIMTFGLFALTSCGSDDKDEPQTPAARSIAGTYNGDMTCSVMGSEDLFEDMTFTVTAVDDSKVNITISSFGNPPMQVPEITIKNVAVSGSDGNYTIATTNFEGDLANGKKYSGVIQGNYASEQLNLQFNLQYGAMPMPMICNFSAPKN